MTTTSSVAVLQTEQLNCDPDTTDIRLCVKGSTGRLLGVAGVGADEEEEESVEEEEAEDDVGAEEDEDEDVEEDKRVFVEIPAISGRLVPALVVSWPPRLSTSM